MKKGANVGWLIIGNNYRGHFFLCLCYAERHSSRSRAVKRASIKIDAFTYLEHVTYQWLTVVLYTCSDTSHICFPPTNFVVMYYSSNQQNVRGWTKRTGCTSEINQKRLKIIIKNNKLAIKTARIEHRMNNSIWGIYL